MMFGLFKRKKRKTPTPPPTYGEFLMLIDVCSEEQQKEYLEVIKQLPRPDYLGHRKVPETFNHLTYGQIDDLRDITEDDNIPYRLIEVIYGTVFDLSSIDVNEVFGFVNFCTSEIQRINKIFASIKRDYSPEEIAAGVEELEFGTFGVLDWYAKRMGIADQNEVRNVAWVRIYQCMKNDNEQQLFEKRVQDQYLHKNRISGGRWR